MSRLYSSNCCIAEVLPNLRRARAHQNEKGWEVMSARVCRTRTMTLACRLWIARPLTLLGSAAAMTPSRRVL